jgi:ATP-binding cassette, subfamily B, bacterial
MNTYEPQEEVFSKHLDLRLWGRLLRHSLTYRKWLAVLFACALVSAAAEVSLTLVTKVAIDDLATGALDRSLWVYGAAYLGTITVMAGCVWSFIYCGGIIATGVSHDIRREGFRRLQELEYAYFDKRSTGWLMSRLTSDCDSLSQVVAWGLLHLVWGTLMVVLIGVVLVVLHWQLAVMVLAVVPALIAVSIYFQRKLLESSRDLRRLNSLITSGFNEAIMGVKTVKAMVRESRNLEDFSQVTHGMYRASLRNALQSAFYMPIVFTLGSAATAVVLWRGGVDVLAGGMTLGTLVAFLSYSGQFFNPVNQIARILTDMKSAQAAAERVMSLLEAEPQIGDTPAVRAAIAARLREMPEEGVAIDGLPARIEELRFAEVEFRYEPEVPVLREFNLTVRAGETIALVGPSGGGKSTIVNLIGRFYQPTSGRILINGRDYRERSLQWLQSNLGIVLQTPHLFNGTIRENIRYGRLEATDGEVEQAARVVNAHGFIRGMESGYDTLVGEGGNRLSTGQKQLVSFARALLANPQIFIMDEATSSIDTGTEQLIQKGLTAVLQGRISFIIAHRLSTVRAADRILFIQEGRIAEAGNHQDLLRRRGLYHSLYMRQFQMKREMELLGRTP